MKSTLSLACGLLVGLSIVSELVKANAHDHDQHPEMDPSHQQHVEAGKINSPNQAALLAHEHRELRYIDLSYTLKNSTLHWPKNKGFVHKMDIDQEIKTDNEGTYHQRSDSFAMATHTGTHMDAPSHFSKDGWTTEKIPIERLFDVPLTVIDLSDKVRANRSYSFLKSDFTDADSVPLIKPKSVVLVYTGVSEDAQGGETKYLGTSTPERITTMNSPGFSLEAAKYLVSQHVYGVGLDAISADSSYIQRDETKYHPAAHVEFNTNNIFILENVNNQLKSLVNSTSARITIAPLPIEGGTGSPVRLVAIDGHDDCHHGGVSNGAFSKWQPSTYAMGAFLLFLMSILT